MKKKNIKTEDIATENELEKGTYKVSFFDRIPYWVKAVLLKYWMFGAIYFFLNFVIDMYSLTYEIVVHTAAYAITSDLIVSHILELWDTNAQESRSFYVFHSKKFYSVFINVVIGFIWALFTDATCVIFIHYMDVLTDSKSMYLFREPLSFALVGLFYEFVLIGIKLLIVKLFHIFRKNKEVI